MGSYCCCAKLVIDRLVEQDSLENVYVNKENNEFVQIEIENPTANVVQEILVNEQNNQRLHRQGSNQKPMHFDSLSELEMFSEADDADLKENRVSGIAGQLESELDSPSEDSISSLFKDPSAISSAQRGMKQGKITIAAKDFRNNQHQRKSSTQIDPMVEVIEVVGAGNPAVNGVYRWFAAHERFVMFSDEGQYQIMRGVDLSEYGEHYHDCWVIEELMKNVILLYAVASSDMNTISNHGWICINGASPAPKVNGLEEGILHEDSCCVGNEESELSLSSMSIPCPSKEWSAVDLDGVECVA